MNYGDDRTALHEGLSPHLSYLRPLLTRAVLDSILDSKEFGAHIDTDNIGITGHSFGGFTALALAGGPFEGNDATVTIRVSRQLPSPRRGSAVVTTDRSYLLLVKTIVT